MFDTPFARILPTIPFVQGTLHPSNLNPYQVFRPHFSVEQRPTLNIPPTTTSPSEGPGLNLNPFFEGVLNNLHTHKNEPPPADDEEAHPSKFSYLDLMSIVNFDKTVKTKEEISDVREKLQNAADEVDLRVKNEAMMKYVPEYIFIGFVVVIIGYKLIY